MNKLLNNYFGFIKKFLPNQSGGNAVGIDIAANECKLVELIKEGEKFKLVSWSIEPIDRGDISVTLKKCLVKLKRQPKSLSTAVFGKGTLIRYISLPRMTLDELKNSFSIESDKYFPFTQDQIYTDCFILDDKAKTKDMAVVAAAAKRELIDQRMKILNDLGVKPDFIGINPMALVNVINTLGIEVEKKDGKSAMALLDLGESVSSLTILVDRLPRFTRDISVGGKDFTLSISNALGVSLQDAERLKANPQDKQAAVIQACESAVNRIVQEITLSFDYFTTEKNMEISDLYLTGGGALLEGLTGAFEKVLDLKVHRWDPFSKIDISSEPDAQAFRRKSFRLGVALGLALYDYD